MFVSVTPSFLLNYFFFTNLTFSTIQGLTPGLPDSYQLPWQVIQLKYNRTLFVRTFPKMICAYKHIQNNFIDGLTAIPPTDITQIHVLDGEKNLTKKSKKEKNVGMEQHRQELRAKKMKKKEKKKVTIPANYRKK